MKKFVSLGMVLTCGVLLAGCSANEKVETQKSSLSESSYRVNSEESKTSSESSSKVTLQGESVDIVAKGEYEVGTDIQPGNYYAVLTKFEYYDDDYKENNLGYVTISQTNSSEDKTDASSEKKESSDTSTDHNYRLESVGAKQRIKLKDGDILNFGDNYDPKDWTVKLLNDDDFKKYTEENK